MKRSLVTGKISSSLSNVGAARMVGKRDLRDETILDDDGRIRVIFRTPNWEDFVHLTFSEIRLYGAENFQVARRLRAMIENLVQSLPERRLPALRQQPTCSIAAWKSFTCFRRT